MKKYDELSKEVGSRDASVDEDKDVDELLDDGPDLLQLPAALTQQLPDLSNMAETKKGFSEKKIDEVSMTATGHADNLSANTAPINIEEESKEGGVRTGQRPMRRFGDQMPRAASTQELPIRPTGSRAAEGDASSRGVGKGGSPDHMAEIDKAIVVGVCCMEKKLLSKPMQSIIKNLASYNELQIKEFREEMLLNEPFERWPQVDVLICFYSSGFPMEKALQYVNTFKPIQINDLES